MHVASVGDTRRHLLENIDRDSSEALQGYLERHRQRDTHKNEDRDVDRPKHRHVYG